MVEFDDETTHEKERLEELYEKEEEELVQILSNRYGIPYIDLSVVSINTDALRLIPEELAREAGAAAFGISGKKVSIAIISPKKEKLQLALENLTRDGYETRLFMASKASLEKAWDTYAEVSLSQKTQEGVLDIASAEIKEFIESVHSIDDLKGLLSAIVADPGKHKTSRMFEGLVAGALAIGASDVHIEPEEADVHIRFRVDGVLETLLTIKHPLYDFLSSRIKLLSGLKLNVKKEAQDGRLSVKLDIGEVEIRTSVLPGGYGESIVMRILNPETIGISFENLGIDDSLFRVLEREIAKPNGLILTTGPTGSGKTTTLYAFLKKVHQPGVKIITIEDPIEYHLPGITQTQASKDTNYTFSSGLRAALRQDPDMIMVGEIRDEETAEIAVNAALTGHLVFSTLHTNDAAGVIPRLVDLGVNPKTISSALNISIAQRLVRKLCRACAREEAPTEEERVVLTEILAGVRSKKGAAPEPSMLWRAQEGNTSCPTCGGLGYKGRIGVFEGIVTDEAIEQVIATENPSRREIKKAAEPQGILDMREDGVLKVLSGTTTLDELSRVVDLRADAH